MGSAIDDIRRCPLFANLAAEAVARLARESRSLAVSAGEFVFREGQPCEGFYVLGAGAVRVFKLAPDGRERTLHIVRPPHAFAEAAVFGASVFPAFAAAMEDSRLVLVRREPFLRLLREEPDSAARMFESLSQWMHRLLDQLENETFLGARAKLASYLLREVRRQAPSAGPSARIRLSQPKKDIASLLGMAPETFSRAIADLEARGLIVPAGREIAIPDADALESAIWEPSGRD